MAVSGITWQAGMIDDESIWKSLPQNLAQLLTETNGFILHQGALHVRGASRNPDWHSLRKAMKGPQAFHKLYTSVEEQDIPFAQDQLGDQYLLRRGEVLKLSAEADEVEPFAKSLEEFLQGVEAHLEEYLNVSCDFVMEPGQLLLAWPPFIVESESPELRPIDAGEVISLHADLARQIRDLPDGGEITLAWEE